MIMVNIVAEGQSELYFAKSTLMEYVFDFNHSIIINAMAVLTSRDLKRGTSEHGGFLHYKTPKKNIIQFLKQSSDTYVTTMFDFYGLPHDFPGYAEAMEAQDHYESVRILERELKNDIINECPDINPNRFIPYIQLHEFESLIFSNLEKLKNQYMGDSDIRAIDALIQEVNGINPEEINHGYETAPSKRLKKALPYSKGDDSRNILTDIGMDTIIASCKHFSEWVHSLEKLEELNY